MVHSIVCLKLIYDLYLSLEKSEKNVRKSQIWQDLFERSKNLSKETER